MCSNTAAAAQVLRLTPRPQWISTFDPLLIDPDTKSVIKSRSFGDQWWSFLPEGGTCLTLPLCGCPLEPSEVQSKMA